jgi:hypothetical protein
VNDRAKKAILSRRARFVAAAIATMGVNAVGCASARNCLSAPDVPSDATADGDAAADGADSISVPEACLGAPWDDGVDTGTTDAAPDGDADTGPTVCLNVVPDSSPDGATG